MGVSKTLIGLILASAAVLIYIVSAVYGRYTISFLGWYKTTGILALVAGIAAVGSRIIQHLAETGTVKFLLSNSHGNLT